MKKSAITATSSIAILVALGSSVSAGGLDAALTEASVVAPATADLCAPSRSLDVRAGALRTDNVWADEAETYGSADKLGLGDAEGGFADASYNWDRCDSDLTIGGGFLTTDMSEEGSNDFDEIAEISDEVSIAYLDATYGRPLNDSLRYFGGLRVLNYEADSTYGDGIEDFFLDERTLEASFTGVGPIVGVSYETPNQAQGEFGVFGKASAAALFGSLRTEQEGFFRGDSEPEESDETIVSLDAELGVFYNVTDNSAVNFGITYRRLNDIDNVSANAAEPDDDALETGDREFMGAFLGYSYQF